MTLASLPAQSLLVGSGAANDLSALRLTAVPAGSNGRIQIHGSDATKLAEANDPTTAVRLMVATWAPDATQVPLPSTQAEITAGVAHLARQGFNAMRVHGLEYWLMDGTTGAYNFPAAKLDLFDFFLSECKRLGLYWIFNPRQPELYQDGEGNGRFSMPGSAVDMKVRLFVQENARTMWHTGFDLLYNRVNPYTGINMLQDPALYLVECINECSAQQSSQSAWPAVWTTRDSAQGTGAKTWTEWLADSTQAHGYANIAALNTSWGTAYANFAAVPAPTSNLPNLTMPQNQISIDVVLYISYLDDALADYFTTEMAAFGYTGLTSSIISFPNSIALRNSSRKSSNSVNNLHDYPFLAPTPAISAALSNSANNFAAWEFESWCYSGGMWTSGKPSYIGEYGWPYWGQWRNQYPLLGAFAAMQGVCGISLFYQGNFFDPEYNNTTAKGRTQVMYPYSGQADPVTTFSQAAMFFAYALGYVSEASYTFNITLNDRYYGVNPRSTSRINRSFFKMFLPTGLLPGVMKTRVNWTSDTTSDALAATVNATSWYSQLAAALAAGGIAEENKGYQSALANQGTITAVATTGTIGSKTASVTQPVLTLSGSNTLVDGDQIAITNLAGSVGTWPGTSGQGTRAYIAQTGVANRVQITSGLNLTGLDGANFTSGTFSEFANELESSTKEIRVSRRKKFAAIDAQKFWYYVDGGAVNTYPYSHRLGQVTVQSITSGGAFFVAPLDNKRLMASNNLLIGLVGNAQNTGQSFTDATNTTLAAVGTYPIQIEQVTVVFRLTVERALAADLASNGLTLSGSSSGSATMTVIDANTLEVTVATGANALVFFNLRRAQSAPLLFWSTV